MRHQYFSGLAMVLSSGHNDQMDNHAIIAIYGQSTDEFTNYLRKAFSFVLINTSYISILLKQNALV